MRGVILIFLMLAGCSLVGQQSLGYEWLELRDSSVMIRTGDAHDIYMTPDAMNAILAPVHESEDENGQGDILLWVLIALVYLYGLSSRDVDVHNIGEMISALLWPLMGVLQVVLLIGIIFMNIIERIKK